MIHSNHGPISYRFLDRRRFQSIIAKFSHPLYFAPPLKWFPLELGIAAGVKKLDDGATGPTKKFDDIFSRLECTNVTDRQTDGPTDGPTPGHRKTALTHSVVR